MEPHQQQESLTGKELGPYLIKEKLGEGGMAQVYKAYHARLRRDVALKVMAAGLAKQNEFQARFEQEAQAAASLQHHNIVAVYDFFSDANGLMYLVMQYVGGGTLRDQLVNEQPLDPLRATHYALQMARALHHAHQHGIIHRDVKPQNMLVSATDPQHLLLSDFGIAKLYTSDMETLANVFRVNEHQPANPGLTQADQLVGTADYIAPEQVLGQPADARSDVYALGVVLYQMLTGKTPFKSETLYGLLVQHVHFTPPPVSEVNPYVPVAIAQIVEKALQKNPQQRFQSAEAMAQALETVTRGVSDVLTIPRYQTPSTSPSFGSVNPPISQIATQGSFTSQPVSLSQSPQASLSANPLSVAQTTQQTETTIAQNPLFQSSTPNVMVQTPSGIARPQLVQQPVTTITGNPLTKKRKRISPLYTAAMVAILVLAILLIAQRIMPLFVPTSASIDLTGKPAQSFNERFQNNTRNWTLSGPGFTGKISNGYYNVTSTDGGNHVALPDEKQTGLLPDDFTLILDIAPFHAASDDFYGLAFRLQRDDEGKFSSYVFVINGHQQGFVTKYTDNQPSTLASGTDPIIKTDSINTLQVRVRKAQMTFKINGKTVEQDNETTMTDETYTGGQAGIFLSGHNATFQVSHFQLQVGA